MSDHRLAILVLSCDKYSDLWPSFLQQFKRFFPAEDYPLYLGSNQVTCEDPDVTTILSGDDPDWSTSFKRILAQIDEPKLFIILEDLFLTSPVDNEVIQAALSFLFEKNAMHIKYWQPMFSYGQTENPKIGVLPKRSPFRATVCGFWDRQCLMNLLIEGENPWEFEILGSYRTSYLEGFYGLNKTLCSYQNMVEKGSWIPQSVTWANEEKIALEIDQRPVFKGGNKILCQAKMLYFEWMLKIPWQWRVRLMNKLRRALISY